MFSTERAIPKRLNGKQQACEPCRKSKQRCDHTTPICTRCKRRRVASECRYEPSPIKISSPKPNPSPARSTIKKVPKSNPTVDLHQPDSYEIFAAGSPYVQKCPNGYLGPTAYSAIFLEHQGKLDLGLLDPCRSYSKGNDDARVCEHSHHVSVPHSVHCHTPNGAAIRLGMDLLKAMPGQEICERLIERYAVFEDLVSHKPTIKIAHQSWWETYGIYLSEPRDLEKLSVVSEELCRNAWSLLETELPKNQREWVASCYLLWKRHGSLVSSVTAYGLHREPKEGYPDTFMASELRKRQFIGVFITDKTLATMTGRPPLLSRRYSTCQLPLDLSEEQLMADEPELSHIRSKLDSDGWNTSGEVYPSTWARALLLMNLIREEVLEMSLSISNDCSELMLEHLYPEPERKDAQERCADLIRRCVEMYERLPQSVRYDPNEPVGTNAHVFPRKVGLHMLYLHCQFLLERLCVSRTHASSQRIVDLAMQMLDDVLIMWAKRDWLVDFQWRFNHYFTMYGVPSAGVLCVELLKATKSPSSDQLNIPRSEVMQKLSIFISCLEWARPENETYTLCGHMHKIISHIMDQILAPNPTTEIQSADAMDTIAPSDLPMEEDTDWLQWLNNVDWTKGSWVDFG
ncbi:hypothetical protein OEA41_009965 [Lepraria neglecta]|uniref:Zn(2)-C6 fungal-type domain-containing protein n=1 Tax=Lepraria neglecta TaxID=209136 RepID=A0AAE0DF47_9LECA|nr:hypothetical protein OEA41_009965 [Lepraria neglecta]